MADAPKWRKEKHARGHAEKLSFDMVELWVVPGVESGFGWQITIGGQVYKTGHSFPTLEEAKTTALREFTRWSGPVYREACGLLHPEAENIIKKMQEEYGEEGVLEFDDDAVISESDHGCYVECWHWLPEEG